MGPVAEVQARAEHAGGIDSAREQIRGSSLLFAGRIISTGVNFLSQVLVVRYLSTTEYGAWAYGLSLVAFCQGFATVGLDRAITRFVPIYHEKREFGKLFGTLFLAIGSALVAGLFVVTAFYAFPHQVSGMINNQKQPLGLLFIMIFLVPVDALDGMLMGLFACLGNPRAIFFRRYVLAPGLKLAVVSLLVLLETTVRFLAYGYLSASLLGVFIYAWMFWRTLKTEKLLDKFNLRTLTVPVREVFSFTIPLMTSDLVTILMHSSDALLLGFFWNLNEVAIFRVVLPLAILNQIVMNSFSLLYTPTAARLFAKGDSNAINDLYWRTATWMAVLSFPIFATTFSLAKPLTTLLYGERYSQSWVILALISLGYYFNVALGFNGLTLKVLGKLRYVVTINVLAALTNVLINLLLIPRLGALGAAIGTSATLIAHNILKQSGLRLACGVNWFDKRYFPFYAMLSICTGSLLLLHFAGFESLYVLGVFVGILSTLVFLLAKKNLRIEETFPELMRFRLLRLIFA